MYNEFWDWRDKVDRERDRDNLEKILKTKCRKETLGVGNLLYNC